MKKLLGRLSVQKVALRTVVVAMVCGAWSVGNGGAQDDRLQGEEAF